MVQNGKPGGHTTLKLGLEDGKEFRRTFQKFIKGKRTRRVGLTWRITHSPDWQCSVGLRVWRQDANCEPGTVAHIFKTSAQEVEARGSL